MPNNGLRAHSSAGWRCRTPGGFGRWRRENGRSTITTASGRTPRSATPPRRRSPPNSKSNGRGQPRPLLRLRLCATTPLGLWLQMDERSGSGQGGSATGQQPWQTASAAHDEKSAYSSNTQSMLLCDIIAIVAVGRWSAYVPVSAKADIKCCSNVACTFSEYDVSSSKAASKRSMALTSAATSPSAQIDAWHSKPT